MKMIKYKTLLVAAVAFFAALNVQASYDPSTGRWFSRDPSGERGGQNLYGLLNNDPCDRTDYLGLDTGTVSVDENHAAGRFSIGWVIKLRWTPPDSWKGQKANCLPCKEAVWVQDKKYDIEYFAWQFWLKNVHTGWTKDWDETDYQGSSQTWEAYASAANWNSTMHDEPGVGLAKSVFFSANAKVKCLAGPDIGKIYATVEWGYYDFISGNVEASGGGLGY
jgi:uncharacterized protein RhaS with RHS repeats